MRFKDKVMFKYYVYRHIRLDINQVFYIGMGTKANRNFKSIKQEYKRAFDKSRRNILWKNIINKTNYEVEIIFESNDIDEVKRKEIEFINLYGRKDFNKGLLVNLTDGGDGTLNKITSKETKIKQSKSFNREVRKKYYDSLKKRCIHLKDKREFESLKSGCKFYGYNYANQKMALKHKRSTSKFMFIGEEFSIQEFKPHRSKRCRHIESGVEFNSLIEGCKTLNINYIQQKDANHKGLKTKEFEFIK